MFGMILFSAAFPMLWWNEGNAVAVYNSLKEAKSEVVALRKPVASGDTKGRLVHLTAGIGVSCLTLVPISAQLESLCNHL